MSYQTCEHGDIAQVDGQLTDFQRRLLERTVWLLKQQYWWVSSDDVFKLRDGRRIVPRVKPGPHEVCETAGLQAATPPGEG